MGDPRRLGLALFWRASLASLIFIMLIASYSRSGPVGNKSVPIRRVDLF